MAIHPKLRSPASADSQHGSGQLTPQQARAISAWTEQATASLQDLALSDPAVALPLSADASAASASAMGATMQQARQASSPSTLRGSAVPLCIPLDDDNLVSGSVSNADPTTTTTPRLKIVNRLADESRKGPSVSFRRREPIRRDSLKRREALLKGKDGSRRRQRWENGIGLS